MSARAMASGTISFGLVAIPVKLYSTGESSAGIRFNQIHKKCGSRVKQQLYCPVDEEVVGRDEIVKGYEFSKGQYVLFTDEELKALTPKATHSIDIVEFVPLDRVDPIYYDKTYYLGPDKGGDRPYKLLSEALKETGRAAVARYAARGKDYLVLVRPFADGLILQQLRYADEIRSFSEVPLGQAEIKKPEMEMALQLVSQNASDSFQPEEYKDAVKEQIQAMIEKKVQGEEITAAPEEPPKAQIIDLMAALKASLAEGDKAKPPARKPARAAKPAAKKPRASKKKA